VLVQRMIDGDSEIFVRLGEGKRIVKGVGIMGELLGVCGASINDACVLGVNARRRGIGKWVVGAIGTEGGKPRSVCETSADGQGPSAPLEGELAGTSA
ncbi:hypothetical protein L7F22_000614, partial [Adiantum nelumboides]|nr:hypothetical protein [Adiantum nelumboides]